MICKQKGKKFEKLKKDNSQTVMKSLLPLALGTSLAPAWHQLGTPEEVTIFAQFCTIHSSANASTFHAAQFGAWTWKCGMLTCPKCSSFGANLPTGGQMSCPVGWITHLLQMDQPTLLYFGWNVKCEPFMQCSAVGLSGYESMRQEESGGAIWVHAESGSTLLLLLICHHPLLCQGN